MSNIDNEKFDSAIIGIDLLLNDLAIIVREHPDIESHLKSMVRLRAILRKLSETENATG